MISARIIRRIRSERSARGFGAAAIGERGVVSEFPYRPPGVGS